MEVQGNDDLLDSIMEEMKSTPDIIQPSPVRLRKPNAKSTFGTHPTESFSFNLKPSLPPKFSSNYSSSSSPSSAVKLKALNVQKKEPDFFQNDKEQVMESQDVSQENLFDDDDDG